MKNDPCSYDRNFCNCVKKSEKNSGLQRGLNPWPRDTGATLYQLSYEATDVGSRPILGSYVPVKDMKVNDAYEINHMWKLQIWNKMKNDPSSYDRNFYNCVKKPEKNSGLQRGLNPWPRDTGTMLYQLSYEATDIVIYFFMKLLLWLHCCWKTACGLF